MHQPAVAAPPENASRLASRCRSTTWCRSTECPSMVGFLTEGGPDLHRRLAEPGRPARHLHDQRHPPAVGDQPADHRVAPGLLQRQGDEPQPGGGRDLPDDAEQLRRRPGLESAPRLAGPALRSRSVAAPRPNYTTPTGATGCENVPFNPEIAVTADGGEVRRQSRKRPRSTSGSRANPEEPIANSYLKIAKVTLPEGMGINPSAGNTITSCSDDQFHYHTNLGGRMPGGVADRHRRRSKRRGCRTARSPARSTSARR